MKYRGVLLENNNTMTDFQMIKTIFALLSNLVGQ